MVSFLVKSFKKSGYKRLRRDKPFGLWGFVVGLIISIVLAAKVFTQLPTYLLVLITIAISALTTWLGWLSGLVLRIATKVPDRKDLESYYSNLVEELTTENALIRLERVSSPVHAVVSGYANTKVCHLIEHGEFVFIDEYLDMLERSLVLADEGVFATSLLVPQTWLRDDSYLNYLTDQKRKVETSQIHIRRVFVCSSQEFKGSEEALIELKAKHTDANIALGFCDREKLVKQFGKDFYKDFVTFVSRQGSWVIDGGKVGPGQVSGDRVPVKVIIHHRPESVNRRFRSLQHRITQLTDWLVKPPWFDKE